MGPGSKIIKSHAPSGIGGAATAIKQAGPALQGLVSTKNRAITGAMVRRIRTRAGGGNSRHWVFCINQLGGVGRKRSQFGPGNRGGVGAGCAALARESRCAYPVGDSCTLHPHPQTCIQQLIRWAEMGFPGKPPGAIQFEVVTAMGDVVDRCVTTMSGTATPLQGLSKIIAPVGRGQVFPPGVVGFGVVLSGACREAADDDFSCTGIDLTPEALMRGHSATVRGQLLYVVFGDGRTMQVAEPDGPSTFMLARGKAYMGEMILDVGFMPAPTIITDPDFIDAPLEIDANIGTWSGPGLHNIFNLDEAGHHLSAEGRITGCLARSAQPVLSVTKTGKCN